MVRRKKKFDVYKPYIRGAAVEHDQIHSPNRSSGAYPFNLPVFEYSDYIEFHDDVTFLVGENGSGKSTLLEAIALEAGFSGEGGSLDHRFETCDTVSALRDSLRLKKGLGKPTEGFFLRAETFFNFASFIDTQGPGTRYGNSLHRVSHGESFLQLLTEGLRGNGLYLLDEPEAALSPARQLAALVRIDDLVKSNSQFIIATHSPILMAYPRARILLLDETGISRVDYEETEHFRLTRSFLNNYEQNLHRLLESE